MRTLLLFVAAAGLLAGCTQSGPAPQPATREAAREPTVKASGVVLVDGKPAGGANILFVPLTATGGRPVMPAGITDKEGKFELYTYEAGDGGPAGRYAVTVSWHVPFPGDRPTDPYSGEGHQPDRLGGKYADPKTTPLRAEIKESGPNTLEFKLEDGQRPAKKPAAATPATPKG